MVRERDVSSYPHSEFADIRISNITFAGISAGLHNHDVRQSNFFNLKFLPAIQFFKRMFYHY